jgi:ankyrin repeat protein
LIEKSFEEVRRLIDNDDFEGVGTAINNSGRTFGLDRLLKYARNKGKEKFYPVAAHVINTILKKAFSIKEENACLNKDLMNAIYKNDLKKLNNYIKTGSTNAKALSLLYISAEDSFQAEVIEGLTGGDRQVVLDVSFAIASLSSDYERVLKILPLGVDVGLQGDVLILAAQEGHIDVVKALLANGADINAQNSDGDTALIFAVRGGHIDVVKALLDKGADINAKNSDGDTALILAVRGGHVDVVNALLAYKVDGKVAIDMDLKVTSYGFSVRGNQGAVALHAAALEGHVGCVEALLDKGADINAWDSNGNTALMLAARAGHEEVVKALMDKGAKINAQNFVRDTALTLAVQEGHVDVVKALLAYEVDGKVAIDMDLKISRYGSHVRINQGAVALHDAIQEGHIGCVEALLDKGADINARNLYGDTALHAAARGGHVGSVEALLAKGADINAEASDGDTALILAARGGHVGCVEALLAKGADINAKNSNGDTALHAAARGGHVGCVEALLAKGADINAEASDGDTALILAARGGHVGCVEALLAKGADINAKNSNGNTALIFAAYKNHVDVVKLLIRSGADPAIKGQGEKTALDVGSDYMKSKIREEWKRAKLYSIAKPVLYSAVTIGCTGGGYALLLYGMPMVLSVASATYAMLGVAAAFGAAVSFLLGEAYPEGIKDVACKAYTKLGMTRYNLDVSSETGSVGLAA